MESHLLVVVFGKSGGTFGAQPATVMDGDGSHFLTSAIGKIINKN